MVEVTVNNIELTGNEEDTIKKVVEQVLKCENIKHDVDVYITLTNNEEIHEINKQHRNVDSPTDVLSFPMYEREEIDSLRKEKEDDVEEILGDIIISIPKVKEQAEEYGHSYERELAYLTTHGMLHLLGYDHMVDEEKAIMRNHEERVLESLNISRDVEEKTTAVAPVKEAIKNNTNSNTNTNSGSVLPILIAFLVALLIVAGVAFALYKWLEGPQPIVEPTINSGEQIESGEEETTPVIVEPEEPYLGPEVFSGESRSVAVMIDNDVKAAWPHAGLNNAYMIYEITVEGGATRLIAFFKLDNLPDKVGPIRSCRHYFLDYVQEHDAIYCHYGQSTQGAEALKSRGISNINGIVDNYCTRIGPDKTWHNAFASKESIRKYIKSKGYRSIQMQDCIIKFNQKDTDLVSNKNADKLICKYSSLQTTSFIYDSGAKNYLITMKNNGYEAPHVDKFTDERFVAKNILVYQVNNEPLWDAWNDHREVDNKKRQEIYNTGSGTGWYITNGKAIEMKWSKQSHAGKTTYTDMQGNELKFNDGITWVEIVPKTGEVTIVGSTTNNSGESIN